MWKKWNLRVPAGCWFFHPHCWCSSWHVHRSSFCRQWPCRSDAFSLADRNALLSAGISNPMSILPIRHPPKCFRTAKAIHDSLSNNLNSNQIKRYYFAHPGRQLKADALFFLGDSTRSSSRWLRLCQPGKWSRSFLFLLSHKVSLLYIGSTVYIQ